MSEAATIASHLRTHLARNPVGPIAQLFSNGAHAALGGLGDTTGPIVEHPGLGRMGHAGRRGNIGQGDTIM